MKSKAIIFDLDGTAVDSPGKKFPTPNLIKQIARLKDSYYFCAATGRVWSFAQPVLQALNLVDPCIISAGTQICNPQTGEIFSQKNISPQAFDKVITVLRHYPQYKILFNDATEDDYFYGGISPQDFKFTGAVYFFEQVFVPTDIAKEISAKLRKIPDLAVINVVSQRAGCIDIHIINKDATKEHAIEELLKMIEVKKEQTIGIGDGNNDIHLFNAVQYKVAMGNAVEAIKQAADEIVPSVSEDGMARYLEGLN